MKNKTREEIEAAFDEFFSIGFEKEFTSGKEKTLMYFNEKTKVYFIWEINSQNPECIVMENNEEILNPQRILKNLREKLKRENEKENQFAHWLYRKLSLKEYLNLITHEIKTVHNKS